MPTPEIHIFVFNNIISVQYYLYQLQNCEMLISFAIILLMFNIIYNDCKVARCKLMLNIIYNNCIVANSKFHTQINFIIVIIIKIDPRSQFSSES